MKSLIFFLFLIGMIVIIHAIYEQKFNSLKDNIKVEYRFIPRTYYEQQLSDSTVSSNFKNMFEKTSPWFERNVSGGLVN